MDSFNRISHRETELVRSIEDLDIEIGNLERKLSNLNEKKDEIFAELYEVRAKMKTYLEQELGVNTQN